MTKDASKVKQQDSGTPTFSKEKIIKETAPPGQSFSINGSKATSFGKSNMNGIETLSKSTYLHRSSVNDGQTVIFGNSSDLTSFKPVST